MALSRSTSPQLPGIGFHVPEILCFKFRTRRIVSSACFIDSNSQGVCGIGRFMSKLLLNLHGAGNQDSCVLICLEHMFGSILLGTAPSACTMLVHDATSSNSGMQPNRILPKKHELCPLKHRIIKAFCQILAP